MKHSAISVIVLALASICWGDSIPPYLLLNTTGTITAYNPATPYLSASGAGANGGTFQFTITGPKWAHGYLAGTLDVYASNFSLVGRLKKISFPDYPWLLEAYFTGTYIDPSGASHHLRNYFLVESLNFQTMTVGRGGIAVTRPIPEPSSLWLMASGLLAVGGAAWRKLGA